MLAGRLAHRDAGAIGDLYDEYADRLFSYAVTILRSRDAAADAVQDTMLLAYERIGQLRDQSRLRPWLYAICRNECRRQQRAAAHIAGLEAVPELADSTIDLDAQVTAAEAKSLVTDALVGLSDADREVLELALRQDLDAAGVAAVLHVDSANARARMSRARTSLEQAVGALLVWRSGQACAELSSAQTKEFTPLLRKRLVKHLAACPRCAVVRGRAVKAIALVSLPLIAAPIWLRDQGAVQMSTVAAGSELPVDGRFAEQAADVSGQRAAFDRQGWPRWDTPHRNRTAVLAIGAALVVIGATGTAVVIESQQSQSDLAATQSATGQTGAPTGGGAPVGSNSAGIGVDASRPCPAAVCPALGPGVNGEPAEGPGSRPGVGSPVPGTPTQTSPSGTVLEPGPGAADVDKKPATAGKPTATAAPPAGSTTTIDTGPPPGWIPPAKAPDGAPAKKPTPIINPIKPPATTLPTKPPLITKPTKPAKPPLTLTPVKVLPTTKL